MLNLGTEAEAVRHSRCLSPAGQVLPSDPSLTRQSGRRAFLRRLLVGAALLSGIGACARGEPLLRIGGNNWPGYRLMHLAAARGYFDRAAVRLIEMPTATTCIHGLAAGTLEGACLTLDEVLTAQAGGISLKVVCVLDVSLGADVLLARPDIRSLDALAGHRIGVEQTSLGAVMLDAALGKAGLDREAVKLVHVPHDRQRQAFLSGEVDALITFEPVPCQLRDTEVVRLFSSAEIPGRIVDVLAVRPIAMAQSPDALRQLLAGHFRARAAYLREPGTVAPILAGLLKVAPEQVSDAFSGIDLPDVAGNRQWLSDESGRLARASAELVEVMRRASLLPKNFSVTALADPRFLPSG